MLKKWAIFLLLTFVCSISLPYVYALDEVIDELDTNEEEEIVEAVEEKTENTEIVKDSTVEEKIENDPIINNDGQIENVTVSNNEIAKEMKETKVVVASKGEVKVVKATRASTGAFEQVTSYTGKKIWDDASDIDELRPTSLNVVLLVNGVANEEYTATWTKNENEWTYTFENLPIFDANGKAISYSVDETKVPEGYELTKKVTPTEYTINIDEVTGDILRRETTCSTVEFQLSKTSADLYFLVAKKGNEFIIWTNKPLSDSEKEAIFNEIEKSGLMHEFKRDRAHFAYGEGKHNLSDGYITVTVDSNGNGVLTFDDPSTWSYWGEATLEAGKQITYNPGTTELTNTHEVEYTEATVVKVWDDKDDQDGIRPGSITMTLSNGDTVELSESNDWTATIKDLPKSKKGVDIEYSWTETEPTGYKNIKTEKEGTTTTITNQHIPEETEATVVKVWDDKDDQDGIRPTSITMTLSNGDTVELSESNDWTATIDKLPKKNKGVDIEYTWSETEPGGYKMIKAEKKGTTTTITNQHIPEVKNIIVTKVWDDDDDANGARPGSVTVRLIANNNELESAILSDENGWTYTFEKYAVNEKGKEIEYEVTEDEVNLYKTNIEKTDTGFVVTNKYDAPTGDEEEEEEEPVNPHTADHISTHVRMLFMSVMTIINCAYFMIKKN